MIEIDADKLKETIELLLRETEGVCTATGVCIGVVGKKQIQLKVEADPDEYVGFYDKYECVKKVPE